jgi:Fe-S-cluster containining protein
VFRGEDIVAHLERDDEEDCHRMKTTPCPFLGTDERGTIYDVRPEKCRGYFFTDMRDFALITINPANKALVCRAVFCLVKAMKRRLRR